jgi:hypothetical protein
MAKLFGQNIPATVQQIDRNGLDWSRAYLFSISIPQVMTGDDNTIRGNKRLTTLCRSTELPNYEVESESVNVGGVTINLAQKAKFTHNWRVEFLSDDGYIIKKNIMLWMGQAVDVARVLPSSPKSYKADGITVSQLDRSGSPVMTYTFYGMYPFKTGNIGNFSHNDINPSKFTVDFKFDYFTIEFKDTSPEQIGTPASYRGFF